MIFSYNWLKDFVKLPKPDKLAELLTIHSFEVEEIKKIKGDWLLDIDVLPNRGPDCFSHIGIARECAALTSSKLKVQKSNLKEDKNLKSKDFITIGVQDAEDCQRYTARVIADIKVKESPKRIQERLKVCGLKPISNIVDIANYVMLETGQPLHAFDFEKIGGKKIIVRRAKRGEKTITLDNEKYDLDKDILIISDEKGPLAIAGIKGGKKAEIDKKTKTVVLESANFNPRVVRRSSQKLGFKTDASWRFEHGIDPNLTEIAINRAADLIQQIAGGKVASGLKDFYPKKVSPKRIKLDLNYLERLLGTKIPEKKIIDILKRLDFGVKKVSSNTLLVEIPTRRLDISLPENLIEEVGRIYGYGKISATFPTAALIPPQKNFEIFWEDMTKNILKETRFSEVYNYSFIGEKEADIFNCNKKELIELENPTSQEFKYLRPSLIPNLVKNAKNNFRYFDRIRIFELGKVFLSENLEKRMLSGLIADKKSSGEEFYRLKGIIDSLFNKLGISDIWYDKVGISPDSAKFLVWNLKKCAEIKIGNDKIGFLGEVSEKILEKLKIKEKIFLFDLDFEKIIKLCSEEHEYQPISQHPAAVRDLAVLVPGKVKVVEVLNKIGAASGPSVRDVDLFDIYEGEELPRGKKNLAFHIIYQAEDRTLTAKEIDEIQDKIINALESEVEWEVRR